jgi:hypothetical protein
VCGERERLTTRIQTAVAGELDPAEPARHRAEHRGCEGDVKQESAVGRRADAIGYAHFELGNVILHFADLFMQPSFTSAMFFVRLSFASAILFVRPSCLQLGLARRPHAPKHRRLGAYEIRAIEHEHVQVNVEFSA